MPAPFVRASSPKLSCLGLIWKCERLCQEQLEAQGHSKPAVAQRRVIFVRDLRELSDFNDFSLKAFEVLEGPFKEQLKEYIADSCDPSSSNQL